MTVTVTLSPFMKFLHDVIGESGESLFTVKEAAELIGRSTDTLVRWRKSGVCNAPSRQLKYGGNTVYLYTDDDIDRLRAYADEMYSGKRTDLA